MGWIGFDPQNNILFGYGCVRAMWSVLWTKFQPPTLEDTLVCRPTAGGRRPPAGRRAPASAHGPHGPHGHLGPCGPEGPHGPHGLLGPHGPYGPHGSHGPHIQFVLPVTSSFFIIEPDTAMFNPTNRVFNMLSLIGVILYACRGRASSHQFVFIDIY